MAWTNWAGTATAHPAATSAPRTPEEVAAAIRDAGDRGLPVRMRGSGHSFTDVAATDGVMLEPSLLRGVVAVDRSAMTVTVLAGTPLHELNTRLDGLGLALHNLGDIDRQTVAGALSTGTHGTGGTTASLAGQVEALELVDGCGTLRTVSRTEDPDLFHAALVGLGAVGVLTTITFRVEPSFVLEADERPMHWAEAVSRHDELVSEHHHVDMYWFPHTDRCLVKLNDRTLDDPAPLSRARAYVEDELLSNAAFGLVDRLCTAVPAVTPRVNRLTSRGWGARSYRDHSHRVFVAPRRVVFKETEYAVPRAAGMAALAEVRGAVESSRLRVAWPVEVRATPPDEAWLSTTHGRESVYLAFHVGRGVDHREYFGLVERILRSYDGRPHWGKLHGRTAADLAPAYPHWDDFARVRDRVDPTRVFGNDYLDRVLG
jgi:L-gulono-1,4-lactone dehydrogenase